MQAAVLIVFEDLFVRLSVFAMVGAYMLSPHSG